MLKTEREAENAPREEAAAWLQHEIAGYQEALVQWQLWGQQKEEEIGRLQEQYTGAVEQLQQLQGVEQQQQQLPEGRTDDKVNEALKLVRVKDLELQELKETVDRLQEEKSDLAEEVQEVKKQLEQLDSGADTLKQLQEQLEEVKGLYDRAKQDEGRLKTEIDKVFF